MKKLRFVCGLFVVFGILGFGNTFAATAYYLGSCDYLMTKVSSNPSTEPLYSLGLMANEVCYANLSCSRNNLEEAQLVLPSLTGTWYCGGSNWYSGTTTGKGVFCFSTQSECKKMVGQNCLNNPANSEIQAKGIQVTSANASAISSGTVAQSVTTQNDAWFACCATCTAASTSWTTAGVKRFRSAGNACDASGSCNAVSGYEVQCNQNYYATGGVGTVVTTGSPTTAIVCELCPYVGDADTRGTTSGAGSVLTDCRARPNYNYTDSKGTFRYPAQHTGDGMCYYGIDCSNVTAVCRNADGTSGTIYETPLGEAVSGSSQACWCSVTDSTEGVTKWWFLGVLGPSASGTSGTCNGTCPRICATSVPRARLGCS